MARIGNETKLVLKLAQTRMDAYIASTRPEESDSFSAGYKHGVAEYRQQLMDIVSELERS